MSKLMKCKLSILGCLAIMLRTLELQVGLNGKDVQET